MSSDQNFHVLPQDVNLDEESAEAIEESQIMTLSEIRKQFSTKTKIKHKFRSMGKVLI